MWDMSREADDYRDNISRQRDEVEALSAIYGGDFITTDASSNIYEVWIKRDLDPNRATSLRFVLPPQYPSAMAPVFEIHALWLTARDELGLVEGFHEIAQENQGEIVLFLWIESLREFVEKKEEEREKRENALQTTVTKGCEDETELMVKLELEKDTECLPYADGNHPSQEHGHNEFNIIHGEPFTDRKSTFQAHLAEITSRSLVKQVLTELKSNRKVANASHNVMAYRIFNEENNSYVQDCDDDGENAAGGRLLHLLQITDVKNVIVVVTRWCGGLLLGPNRFKHYNNAARNLLQSCGLLESKTQTDHKESKGKHKTNKYK